MKKIAALFLLFTLFITSNSWSQLRAIDDVLVGRANNPNPSNSSGDRIYFNDLFNGVALTPATIGGFTMTETVPDPTGFTSLNTAFGFVSIAASTPAGLYYITYEICENADPTNCDTAIIEIRIFDSTTSSGSGSFGLNVTSSAGSINCSGDVCITDGGCIDQATGTIPPINLAATFTEVGESNTYGVRAIPFNPPFSFGDTAGDTALTTDDNWSAILNFAFNFEFYQNDYTNCVLSTNGAVSFDTSNAGGGHFWTPAAGATIPNNTDAALRDGNIFGAIHDTDPSASGTLGTDFNITYGVKGTAPFRVFVFSFFNVAQFSSACNSLKTSQMILFYESTNVIEVYMFQKPVCPGWAGGRAAIGIQNDAGTQGIAPPGRNTGVYDISVPEAWQFFPNGTPIYDFEWLDETGTVLGTDPTNLTVAPSTTTTYIAQLTYTDAITGEEWVAVRPITVVVQPTPVITLTSNNPICSGGDAEFTITGSEGDVVDYNVNGGATQQVTLDATGVFVLTIPGVTTDQTVNLENVFNADSGCNGVLTDSETVTVNNSGSAGFTLTPTCDGATASITGTSGGTFAFNPVPTDGATIDATTGTITNGVPGTMYTVEYSITGACSATSTEDVTVLPADDASFTTTPTCDGGTVTITGTTGGTFAFNPVPTDGATIDSTTGIVTGGTSGATYTIEYTTMGSCPETSTEDVTALTTSNPAFTTTPTCDGGTVTITGDTGGTFTFNPVPTDGAMIDAATGTVTGGTSGATYTIEYTISGACGSSNTEDVTVLTTANPAFATTDTCDGGTATITGDTGGTFAFNPVPTDGATIDAATGTVTNGVPGTTYTIEYTISGTCGASSAQNITVLPNDDASFTTTPTCDGGTVTITGTTGGSFAFNPVPTDGATIDSTTGTVTGGTSGATYTIEYTTTGVCPATSTEDVTALTTANPAFTTTPTCDGGTVTITGDTGGAFTFNPVPTDGAMIDAATGTVTGGTSGATYTIEYTITGACGASSTEDVTVLTTANPAFTTTDTCDGGTVTITGDTGGTFAFNPVPTDGATIDAATGTVTNGVPGATYTIEYTISGSCGASSTQNITVLPNDDASFTTTPTCDGGTVTITGTTGGTFAFNPIPTDGATIDTATGTITGGGSGVTYTIEYTTTGVCPDVQTQDITVLTTANPAFTTTPTCDGGTVTITGDTGGAFAFNPVPTDGAVIDTATGTVTGGTSGATYTIEYTITGTCGASSTEDVTVYPQEDPSYTVLENCDGGTMTIVGDAGGTFAFNPIPTDGATIDAATGAVTNGTPGATYTVQYTTGGPCPESSFQNVTVLPADDASFTTTPTCDGGTVTILGNTGGTFALNPVPTDGAVIDAATGTVTGGTSGVTYTIEYITAGACPATNTEDVTVIIIDDASFTVSPTCDGGAANVTGLAGGTFAFNPVPTDGAVIDAVTGEVTGGTPGVTYTIEYTTNGTCPNSSTQSLNVHPLPALVNPTPLVVCDDAIVDGMTEMDLTVKNNQISGGNPNYVVTYYNSLLAAQAGMPEVTPSDTAYIGTDGETLWVRVEDNTTGCFDTTTLDLEVTNGPVVAMPTPLQECDVDNDGLATFDLSSARDEILAVDPTLMVSFHLTEQNALDGANPQGDIVSNVAGQIIYIRVSFGTGADCPTVVELMLIVEPSPDVATDIDPYDICDEDNDGMASFNLNTMGATIYGTQNPADFTLTYHESLADAEAVPGMNPIIEPQLSDYVSGNTTIYVRLEGMNGCVTVGQFELIVNPQPVIPADAQDSIYEICDDSNDNDGFATFDLTTQNDALTGGDASLVVDYFETMMDVPNNPIADYSAYDNTSVGGLPHNPQTLFVTVTETTSGSSCYALTTLTLVVNTLPTPNDVLPDLDTCDDNNPGDLQEEFDLTQNEGLMLNDFDETVTYYETFADAQSGDNAIATPTNYTNISTPQTIYVRVTNTGDPANPSDDGTGCYTIIDFDIIVNPLPVFVPDNQYVICVNTNGTEVVGPPFIDTGLNPAEYTFEWVDENGTVVSIDSNYTATSPGTYTVEITNISTGCFNIFPVVVEESSPPIVVADVTTEAFADIPVIQVTATGDASAIFEFSIDNGPWVSNDPNDNTYTFTNVSYGEHIITARDINGCGIGSDTVFVIDYPLFFTPNNDGDNDTWQISGINPDAVINIFDRYGKLLKQLSPTSQGWDGTLNGYPLPSSDYWFTVVYKESPDNSAMKEFKAHFTLKR